MNANKAPSAEMSLWERIRDESELIAIFVLFLAVLIAHETLVEIAEKTSLLGIVKVWLVLLGASLIFFVWVVRYGLNKTRDALRQMLDARLNPLTDVLRVTARNIELNNLEGLVNAKIIQPERAILELEKTVDKSIWVCSPDFRFELGVMGAESYMDVIADNLVRGIPYYYFVPLAQDTVVAVERFSDGLETALSSRLTDTKSIESAMQRVHVVGLSAEHYPATEALGSAVYQFRNRLDVYVGYFPAGKDGWNITLSNQSANGANGESAQHITATLGRLYHLLDAAKSSRLTLPNIGIQYYAKK